MNSGALLKAVNLHKVFLNGGRKLEVLKGIDIEIKKEEIVSLIGPSGAGKSTLLYLLAGLDTPTAGEVWFEDGNLYGFKDEERARLRNERFGFVFQFYNLLPEFTALENVMMPGWINRKDRKREAAGFLKEVGLAERLTHRPPELSGGEQQRVAIARALVNKPQMLFCDEPTGNLDSESGVQVCQLLWELCRKNRSAMIIVTHEEKVARQADRIVRIEDGKLLD